MEHIVKKISFWWVVVFIVTAAFLFAGLLADPAIFRIQPSDGAQIPPVIPSGSGKQAVSSPLKLASTEMLNSVLETALTRPSGADDVETWAAANPADALNFIVAGSSWSEGQSILVAATLDGGETWNRSVLPRASDAVFHTDPAVAFDAGGIAYLVNIPATVSGNSGIPLGIEVSRSLDGGLSWSHPKRISANRKKDDKTAIAVDTVPESPFFGRVYIVWKWPGGGIFMSRSDDHGLNYVPPYKVSNDVVSGLSLETLSDGTVVLAANRGVGSSQGIVTYRSVNGGATFSGGARIASTRAQWYVNIPANCEIGALIQTSVVVSKSGPDEILTLLWDDYTSGSPAQCSDACFSTTACRSRSFISRSLNGGLSWEAAKAVTPPEFLPGDQFFSWVGAADQGETLYLAQRSSHEDVKRGAAHTWLLRSEDSGITWDSVARMSSGTDNSTGRYWQGDYLGIAVSPNSVVAAWTDLRSRTTEIYAAALNLSETMEVTPAYSGAWYDPSQDGHGFFLQILEDDEVLIYWFTYDASGHSVWLFGVGSIDDGVITADLYYEPEGPQFPPNFDTLKFQPVSWGSLEMYFFDCDSGRAEWDSVFEDFGSGVMDLERLSSTATLDCKQ